MKEIFMEMREHEENDARELAANERNYFLMYQN